jgi:hypothetical protein
MGDGLIGATLLGNVIENGQAEARGFIFVWWKGDHPPETRACLLQGQLIREVGSGQQESHERRRGGAHYQIDRKARFRRNAMKIRSVKLNNKQDV